MPSVSTIIPTYNRPAFLREALASVLAQTYRDNEILVVDDGSTNAARYATRQIVEEYTRAQARPIRYLYQPHQGVSAARNRGVDASRGEFLAFLDSDDVWQPEKLAHQVAFFEALPTARICQTQETWIRYGVRVNPRKKHRKPHGDIFVQSLADCLVSPSAVMLRRELFERMGGFDEQLPACEDYDLWLRISVREPVYLIDTPLVLKRGGHADQLSRQFWGMDRFRLVALRKLLDSGRLSLQQRQATLSMLHKKCRILANGARKRGKSAEPYRALMARYPCAQSVDTQESYGNTE